MVKARDPVESETDPLAPPGAFRSWQTALAALDDTDKQAVIAE